MNWRFWLRHKEQIPKNDILTEMAELMERCQLEGSKPMLFVLRADALAELKQKSMKLTHGLFGGDYFERLTTIKSVFGVPVCYDSDLKLRVEIWSIREDELKRFCRG